MTMTSPSHALAYAHICDMLRTARRQQFVSAQQSDRTTRSAGAAVLRWLRRGDLGAPVPCVDC